MSAMPVGHGIKLICLECLRRLIRDEGQGAAVKLGTVMARYTMRELVTMLEQHEAEADVRWAIPHAQAGAIDRVAELAVADSGEATAGTVRSLVRTAARMAGEPEVRLMGMEPSAFVAFYDRRVGGSRRRQAVSA